jgi:serine/threonine protein kinase
MVANRCLCVFFLLYPDCPLTHAAPGHYALWENGVHHRDISPSNLMVYKTSDGRWIGVLNDFDLSSTRDTPSGQERTGTVPFMALHLLTKKGIEGQVKHMYQHDAESFIWVLTWVCICYEGGAYIGKGTDLHQWLKVDARGCLKEKSDFLYSGRRTITPSSSYEGIWKVARFCLLTICQHYVPEVVPTMEDQVVFETWLRKNILEANILSPALLDPTSDSPPAHIPPQATPDPAQPHPDPSHGVNNRHTAIRWLQKSSDPHILRAGEQAPFRVRTGDQPSHEPSRRSLLESTQNDVDREHSKDLSNPRNQ